MNTFKDELKSLGYRLMFTTVEENNTLYTMIAKQNDPADPVLITGATGTGKEMFAESFHKVSGRKGEFVAVNCGAIPENLLESELFGYEKGAFTGGLKDGKKGIFELADKGTVFLDEIGDMPMWMQVKLLRFLNDNKFYKVGGTKEIKVDVRIISATNKNLKESDFRKDLYYRINTYPIETSSLPHEEKLKYQVIEWTLGELSKGGQGQDIPEEKFPYPEIAVLIRKGGKPFTDEAASALLRHPFPGNYRELTSILKCSLIKCYARNQDTKKKKYIITHNDLHPDVFTKTKRGDSILDTPPEKFLPKLNELFIQKYEMMKKQKMSQAEIAERLDLNHQNVLSTLLKRNGLVKLKKKSSS